MTRAMRHSINGMAEALREALDAPGVLEIPGCHDVLSALLLQEAGFRSIFLSGYGVAASLLGVPDIGLTTLSETTFLARHVTSAINVPLVVDIDNGYGNEDNVIRAVQTLESAGAAAFILEDQVSPKRCGHTSTKKVVPLEHYLRKLRCAIHARRTPMVVIARTDSMDFDDAIARGKAFHAAGADVVLVDGLASLEHAKRVVDEIPGHKQINLIAGGKTPLLPAPELHELGFKIVLYSTPALYLATQAMRSGLRRLAETHDLRSIVEQSTSFKPFQSFMESSYGRRIEAADGEPGDGE